MRLYLKRTESDESSPNPAPDQIDVGELVMNSVTGKLYTKLTNGTIVEFLSQKICYSATPTISFESTVGFCCYGDIMYVKVEGLKSEPEQYTFTLSELTANNSTISVSEAAYSIYTVTGSDDEEITLRRATIPININILNPDSVNIFKFTISSNNVNITEKTIAIPCSVC